MRRYRGRWRPVVWGFGLGCLAGAVIAVPLLVWFAAPVPGGAGRLARWDVGRGVMFLPLVFLGGAAGFSAAKIATSLPDTRRRYARYGIWWVAGCYALAALAVGVLYVAAVTSGWRLDLNVWEPAGLLFAAATFLAVMGFLIIANATEAEEEREQQAINIRLLGHGRAEADPPPREGGDGIKAAGGLAEGREP